MSDDQKKSQPADDKLAPTVRPHEADRPLRADEATFVPPAAETPTKSLSETGDSIPAEDRPGRSGPPTIAGKQFGDYELIREIARGGMGVVYHARQISLNRTVAVKMILQGQLASAEDIQRFHSEAEAAARLEHAGIVPVYEVGEVDGQHYFSMGYVDGESLSRRVKNGPLPPREAAQIIREVADAVGYAHEHGVVHRDLKPGNILMTPDGHPRVTDFGLAKSVEQDSGLTASGQVLGTPSYMPPEQASGRIRDVGPLADVYSIGGILYCLLTGRPPFQSATVVETLKQVLESAPVSPRLLNPSVDRDLETICLKCLEKTPSHRFDSAADVSAELARYLNGEPIRSRPVGPVTRVWRWGRRKPLAAALTAAVLVLAVAIVLAVSLARSASETRQLADVRSDFEQALDAAALTPEWLEQTETLVARLGQLAHDDQESVDSRLRTYDTFASLIRTELHRPRMDADQAARVQEAIDQLASRTPGLIEELQQQLKGRLSNWLTDFDVSAPFGDRGVESSAAPPEVASVFKPELIRVADDAIRPAGIETSVLGVADSSAALTKQDTIRYITAPLVPTDVPCQSDVQLEARFAADWESAHEVGIALNAGDGKGYDFVLRVTQVRERSGLNAETITFETISGVRSAGGTFVAEVRRNGVPLLRRDIPPESIPVGPLTLRARRVRNDLEFQINSQPPIRYHDPFSLPSRAPGVFGLRWPAGVGLIALTGQHRLRGEATTGLERGDQLYDAGDFAEAAEQYRRQMVEAEETIIQQESRYKLGLCQMVLQQTDNAMDIFGPLLVEGDGQWAALAGVQMWLIHLREKQLTDADMIFEVLDSRYSFEQLAALVPTDVLEEILNVYMDQFGTIANLLRFNNNRVRDMERAAAVDRLLSHDGMGHFHNQMELVRLYRYTEDWDRALAVIEPLVQRVRNPVSIRHYCRVLRFAGQPKRALAELDAIMSGRTIAFGVDDPTNAGYYVDRSRVHYLLGNLAASEADVRQAVAIGKANTDPLDTFNHSAATLMEGFLLEARGQDQAAIEAWRAGYLECREMLYATKTAYGSAPVAVLILGSLSGELTDADANQFMDIVTSNDGGKSLITMASSLVTPQTVAEVMRETWRTPRGHQTARDFAFESISLRGRTRLPVLLTAHTFLKLKALNGVVSDEQDAVLWSFVDRIIADTLERGEMSLQQIMQLGLAWKGTTNILGWAGVAPSLSKNMRAEIAWLLGHRYLVLGKPDNARGFFETAIGDAASESPVQRIASRDLDLLTKGHAALQLKTGLRDLTITVSRDGKSVATLSATETPSVDHLAAGEYDVVIEGRPDVAVSSNALVADDAASADNSPAEHFKIDLPLATTAAIEVASRWTLGDPKRSLPGLVPQPAELSGIGRWQVVRTPLQRNVRNATWSPNGRWIAASCDDATVRIFDASRTQPWRILAGHRNRLNGLSWSPDSRFLASFDNVGDLILWDVAAGRLHIRLPEMNGGIPGIAWHPDSQSLAVGAWGPVGIRHLRIDGTLLGTYGAKGRHHALSWSPDGGRLASIDHDAGTLTLFNPPKGTSVTVAQPVENAWRQVSWSPDGSLIATGSPSTLCLWNATSQSVERTWESPAAGGLHWESDSRHLWSTHPSEPHLRVWDIESSNDEPESIIASPGSWGSMAVSPEGDRVAGAGYQRLRIFDREGTILSEAADRQELKIASLDWSPDGQRLAAGVGRDTAIVEVTRNSKNGELIVRSTASTESKKGEVDTVRWAPDGSRLVAGGVGGQVSIFSPDGVAQAQATIGHARARAVDWSPDGAQMVVAADDGQLHLLTAKGELQSTIKVGERTLYAAAYSPDGTRLATAGDDQQVTVWSIDGEKVATIPLPSGCRSLSWTTEGLAVTSGNRVLLLSNLDAAPVAGVDHREIISAVEWQAQSNRLLSVSYDGSLIESSNNGQKVRTLRESSGDVLAVDISPDGRTIVVGTAIGSIEFYDAVSGHPLGVLLFSDAGRSMMLSASGEPLDDVANSANPFDADLTWIVETASGEQTLMSRSEFFAQIPLHTQKRPTADLSAVVNVPHSLKVAGRLSDSSILEASGLVRSRKHLNTYWIISDSGNPAHLSAIDTTGKVLATYAISGAINDDWETIAISASGRIFIGDVGNGTHTSTRTIYEVEEPDPRSVTKAADGNPVDLPLRQKIAFAPTSDAEDFEASFVLDNSLYFISKVPTEESVLYALSLNNDRDDVAIQKLATVPSINWVTGAAVSPDGSQLALTTYSEVLLFNLPSNGPLTKLDEPTARLPFEAPAIESIAFDESGQRLLLLSEDGSLSWLDVKK